MPHNMKWEPSLPAPYRREYEELIYLLLKRNIETPDEVFTEITRYGINTSIGQVKHVMRKMHLLRLDEDPNSVWMWQRYGGSREKLVKKYRGEMEPVRDPGLANLERTLAEELDGMGLDEGVFVAEDGEGEDDCVGEERGSLERETCKSKCALREVGDEPLSLPPRRGRAGSQTAHAELDDSESVSSTPLHVPCKQADTAQSESHQQAPTPRGRLAWVYQGLSELIQR